MAPHDATWLAELLAHGLIQGSFVPDEPTQEMRNCLRMRKQFVRERSSHVQRIQKTLEDANIRLDSVITDIIVLSGSRMIEVLIAGEADPFALAALAHRRIKASQAELEAALRGRVRATLIGSYCGCASSISAGSTPPSLRSISRSTRISSPLAPRSRS